MHPASHILFAATGSMGDVHPFLATGVELRRRGHRVTVATSRRFRESVEAAGLAHHHMRPEPPADPDFGKRFMDRRHGAAFAFRDYLSPAIAQSFEDLESAAFSADLLVSQSLALAAPLVAEATGIPWLSAVFQPMTLFSADDPPVLPPIPFSRRRPALNRGLMGEMRKYTAAWTAEVSLLRQRLGLSAGGDPIYEGQHSPQGVLAMFSPLLGTPQRDWPAATYQTGAALYREPQARMPERLEAFLDDGEAPIVFTLGSASSQDIGDFYEISLGVARRLHRRALIVAGADHALIHQPFSNEVAAVAYAPFHLVFPRALAVVHAGGIAATCHAVLAQVPQLIVPYAHDQHDNAARAVRLGTAARLSRRRYRVGTAAGRLKRLMAERDDLLLGRWSADMQKEDGAAVAADRIEQRLSERERRRHG